MYAALTTAELVATILNALPDIFERVLEVPVALWLTTVR
jgi:hypothetical protein